MLSFTEHFFLCWKIKLGLEEKEGKAIRIPFPHISRTFPFLVKSSGGKRWIKALADVAQWTVLACEPKGHRFDSQSGHLPGLQARSLVEGL